ALLASELAALAGPEALLEFADASLKDLRLKLPSEVALDEGLTLDDPAVLRDLLREAEDEILARLGSGDQA
ncbi:MAG: hypothetical protein AB7I01_21510, partial [Gammaproteobacteria bacterium]